MAFHAPNQPLNAHSFRECNFYINYLNDSIKNSDFLSVKEFDTVQECIDELRQELSYQEKKGSISSGQIKKMQADFQKHQLSSDDLLWLYESDERFCNWVWCYLREKSKSFDRVCYRDRLRNKKLRTKILPDLDLDICIGFDGLSHDAFKRVSNNMTARKRDIVESFKTSELDISQQQKVVETLLSTWEHVSEDTRVLTWLESDQPTKSNWLWDYLKETGYRLQSKVWNVSNELDKKAAITAIFDMLYHNPDRKSLVIGKMKRAWSQKKFREKTSGKRPYSVSMTDRTKKRLTWLVDQDDSNISDVIKNLIDERYEKLK